MNVKKILSWVGVVGTLVVLLGLSIWIMWPKGHSSTTTTVSSKSEPAVAPEQVAELNAKIAELQRRVDAKNVKEVVGEKVLDGLATGKELLMGKRPVGLRLESEKAEAEEQGKTNLLIRDGKKNTERAEKELQRQDRIEYIQNRIRMTETSLGLMKINYSKDSNASGRIVRRQQIENFERALVSLNAELQKESQ